MERTELDYVINFGLAIYLHRILTENVKRSPYYSILFDERQWFFLILPNGSKYLVLEQ